MKRGVQTVRAHHLVTQLELAENWHRRYPVGGFKQCCAGGFFKVKKPMVISKLKI